MFRLELLLPILIWLSWSPGDAAHWLGTWPGVGVFLGGYGVMVLGVRLGAIRVMRRVGVPGGHTRLNRFNRMARLVNWALAAWFVIGALGLGWRQVVGDVWQLDHLGRFLWADPVLRLPSLLVGVMPAMLAAAGLWWAMYPADRALREAHLLAELNEGLPIKQPPTLRQLMLNKLRMQMLITLLPIVLAMTMSDLVQIVLMPVVRWLAPGWELGIESIATLVIVIGVLIMTPELMVRVLNTQSLPESPLRQRLMEAAKRHRIRCRDILLWHTFNDVGNAAVMGLVPRHRYVLLSDLLVQTMPDEQIEAVFAHEAGHVAHRHLQWLVLLVMSLSLGLGGVGDMIYPWLAPWVSQGWSIGVIGMGMLLLGVVGFFVFFKVCQAFERQADVFAARSIQQSTGAFPVAEQSFAGIDRLQKDSPEGGRPSAVLPYGATIVSAALHRVAVINNIPITARNLTHGSILQRMNVLREMSRDPQSTVSFDRAMGRVRLGIVAVLVLAVGLSVWSGLQQQENNPAGHPTQKTQQLDQGQWAGAGDDMPDLIH